MPMTWARMVAIGGALLATVALPSPASAQGGLTERVRFQGIYAHQSGQTANDDFALQAVPELALLVLGKRAQLRLTYSLSATAHTALPTDISNRVGLASTFDLSKRTTLLLVADAGHSTYANALLTRAPNDAPVGGVPQTAGQIVTARVGEGTSWQASPVVRFNQVVDASYIKPVNAPLGDYTALYNGVLSLDRTWKTDAFGVDLRGGYSRSQVSPLPPVRLVPVALTPHWRHDFTRALTSYAAAGPLFLFSPDAGTRPVVKPYALATLAYLLDDATIELAGSVGTQVNTLTAQLLYAQQVTLRATVPLSLERGVVAAGTVAYGHGTVVDGGRAGPPQPDLDSFIADAGLSWAATKVVDLFARYQYFDQVTSGAGAATMPSAQRHAVIVGIQLTSRPDPVRVPTRFPQRVDQGDAPPPP
jgi:hypothetical protein